MSSPKLLAYKAVIDMANMMVDAIKNPAAISDAGKEYAASLAMTELEIKKREDAVALIEKSQQENENLKKFSSDFAKECETKVKQIKAMTDDAIKLSNDTEKKKNEVDAHYAESINIRNDAKDALNRANIKEAMVSQKEISHQKNIDDFAAKKATLDAWESDLSQKEASITARENRLKAALM